MPVDIVVLSVFASSVFSILGNKLADSVVNKIGNIINAEDRKILKALIVDAREVQLKLDGLDELGDKDLQEVTELCYRVDDIIDSFNIKIMKQHHENGSMGLSPIIDQNVTCDDGLAWVGGFFSFEWNWGQPSSASTVDLLRQQIKKVEEAFDRKRRTCTRFRPRRRGYLDPSNTHLPVGRMAEKEAIIHRILELKKAASRDVPGVCIVGQAGLGKTVVAASILKDDRITGQFKVIKWASLKKECLVSDDDIDIDIETIPIPKKPSSSRSGGFTSYNLLVLDDIPIKNQENWKYLKGKYMQPEQSTVVIITSRDPEVAKCTRTTLHYLQPLSIEDCKEVINSHVSHVLSDYNRTVLRTKVGFIADKCHGLPLVADAIGIALGNECLSNPEKSQAAISRYEDKQLWKQDVFLKDIFPYLGFDEASLPKELCKFLAYLSLFPPEHYFDKGELSQLWMAEGFTSVAPQWTLKPAIDRFDGLVSTSILQRHVKYCPGGRVASSLTYQMHKFAHKFAQIIARSTYYRLDEGTISNVDDEEIPSFLPKSYICHFSSFCQVVNLVVLNHIKDNFTRLRTFLVLSKSNTYGTAIEKIPHSMFINLKYIRVLSLGNSSIIEIPSSIINLKHLRYLDVSKTPIKRLPNGICTLVCLQVLKLKSCPNLSKLPAKFGSLINLIHLELDMLKLCITPTHLGNLTKLQTLPVFIVNSEDGRRIKELSNLNSLKESIKITKLENVTSKEEAKEAMLHLKTKITTLSLEWTINYPGQDSSVAENVLTGLQPSNKVIELRVSNYIGITFPSWVSTLQNVGRIYLYNFPYCNEFPPLGSLRLLKSLTIQKMTEIKEIKRSTTDERLEYPALESLEILYMDKLVKWGSLMVGDMPCLGVLRVSACPKLVSLSMINLLPSSTARQISSCPKLIYH